MKETIRNILKTWSVCTLFVVLVALAILGTLFVFGYEIPTEAIVAFCIIEAVVTLTAPAVVIVNDYL